MPRKRCGYCGYEGDTEHEIWTSHHGDGDSYSCRDAFDCRSRMYQLLKSQDRVIEQYVERFGLLH